MRRWGEIRCIFYIFLFIIYILPLTVCPGVVKGERRSIVWRYELVQARVKRPDTGTATLINDEGE